MRAKAIVGISIIAAISLIVIGGLMSQGEQSKIISPERSTQPSNFQLKTQETISQPTSNCLGSARCFSGSVNKVTDGDTITVDGKQIRFAMASAPELNEFGGKQAREFIASLCPVGSTALVDEDDGQTEGSHGRIIGVIYCNGYNLNEELVDSTHGYLLSGFCDRSEFARQQWAQRHGC